MKLLFVLLAIVAAGNSVNLPQSFKKCNRKQPDFDKCLVEAANYDISLMVRPFKKVALPNFEPLQINQVSGVFNSPLFNVTQSMKNCKALGLTKFRIERFDFNFDEKTINISGASPRMKGWCQKAKIDGTILYVPIKGEGLFVAAVQHFRVNFYYKYKEEYRNGKTYIKEVASQVDGIPEEFTMRLESFFGKDEETDAFVNKLLNDNGEALFENVKDVYLDAFRQYLVQVLDGFFSRVSLEEAFDN